MVRCSTELDRLGQVRTGRFIRTMHFGGAQKRDALATLVLAGPGCAHVQMRKAIGSLPVDPQQTDGWDTPILVPGRSTGRTVALARPVASRSRGRSPRAKCRARDHQPAISPPLGFGDDLEAGRVDRGRDRCRCPYFPPLRPGLTRSVRPDGPRRGGSNVVSPSPLRAVRRGPTGGRLTEPRPNRAPGRRVRAGARRSRRRRSRRGRRTRPVGAGGA